MIVLCLKKLLRFCGSRLNCTAQPFIQKKTTRYLVRRSAVHVAKTSTNTVWKIFGLKLDFIKRKTTKPKIKQKLKQTLKMSSQFADVSVAR